MDKKIGRIGIVGATLSGAVAQAILKAAQEQNVVIDIHSDPPVFPDMKGVEVIVYQAAPVVLPKVATIKPNDPHPHIPKHLKSRYPKRR